MYLYRFLKLLYKQQQELHSEGTAGGSLIHLQSADLFKRSPKVLY